MRTTLGALARWLAIPGLCLIAAILIPSAWIFHHLTGASLSGAEWAKARLRFHLRPTPPLDARGDALKAFLTREG